MRATRRAYQITGFRDDDSDSDGEPPPIYSEQKLFPKRDIEALNAYRESLRLPGGHESPPGAAARAPAATRAGTQAHSGRLGHTQAYSGILRHTRAAARPAGLLSNQDAPSTAAPDATAALVPAPKTAASQAPSGFAGPLPQPIQGGPADAAPLRSLHFLPLLGDCHLRASSIPAPTEDDVLQAVADYRAFREQAAKTGETTDSGFDTLKPQQPVDKPARKRRKRQSRSARDDARHLQAYLLAIVRQGARLTWDVFVPSAQAWQAFANDCARNAPVASLAAYATLLNKLSGQLALQLGPSHLATPTLTANSGSPWNAGKIADISKDYQNSRAEDKRRTANEMASKATAGEPTGEAPAEHKAHPVPTYLLDEWLAKATAATTAHQTAKEALKRLRRSLNNAPSSRPTTRQSKATPGHDPHRRRRAILSAATAKAEQELRALGKTCAGYAAVFLQLLTMTRASSITAGLEISGPGMRHDIKFTDKGMTYVIRFMKDWDSTTSFYGESLPLRFDGPNSIPWGRPDSPNPCARRQAMLQQIQYAVSSVDELDSYDCQDPELQGSDKVNTFLKSIDATGSLRPSDSNVGGLKQHISSHSLRKAGVGIALAAGVSQENIRRWTRWRDAEMLWQYAPNDYPVPPEWHSVFSWMTELASQQARPA